jgi:hypothetical protein
MFFNSVVIIKRNIFIMLKKVLKYIGLSVLLIFIVISYILYDTFNTTAILTYNNSHHSNNKYIFFTEPMFKFINMKEGYTRNDFADKFNNFILPTDGSSSIPPLSNNITKVKNKELFLIKGFVTYTMKGSFNKDFKREYYILEDSNNITFIVGTKIFLYRDKNFHNIEELISYIDNKTLERNSLP